MIAALPMYDWPECRDKVDALWQSIGENLRQTGIAAPEQLIHGAPDLHALWRNPSLIFGQTCWGPMRAGLSDHVNVIGQPDYSGIPGCRDEFYSSAIVLSADHPLAPLRPALPDPAGIAAFDAGRLKGLRFAYNSDDSLSGILGLTEDLAAIGQSLSIFSDRIETGGHRKSIIAVANGLADCAAIDAGSWVLAQRFEPLAERVVVIGWTALRKGLPYIAARALAETYGRSLSAAVPKGTDWL